jgi:hypothetical protein
VGMRWVNELIDRHGRRNWCLFVDADEALVSPGYEDVILRQLIEYLNENGYEAMLARLLDMYPGNNPNREGAALWIGKGQQATILQLPAEPKTAVEAQSQERAACVA